MINKCKNSIDKVMVINAGSSSIKFQLFVCQNNQIDVLWKGAAEGIATKNSSFKHIYLDKTHLSNCYFPNHKVAVQRILATVLKAKVVQQLNDINVIGHRVVHGGTFFTQPTIVDHKVLAKLNAIQYLAPLHIPANLLAIKEFMSQTKAVNIAVFDTAFHTTIPMLNFLFPVSWSWYQEHGVRKYGFHGISYQYLVKQVSHILQVPAVKMNGIICHLGNGSSISAIKNGVSFDNSMGLTPLAGVMMGTRCGDLDPSVFQYIHHKTGMSVAEMTHVLNSKSGLLGISGLSSDLKELEPAYHKEHQQAMLAIDLYVKRITDLIASYFNALDAQLDYLVFSGGIGENSTLIVNKILKNLKSLAFGTNWQLPFATEWKEKQGYFVVNDTSSLKILLIKTNEELVICQSALALLKSV